MRTTFVCFVLCSCLTAICFAGSKSAKPNVWVYTDFTDPRDQREGGYPKGDQDDNAALASLLLSADRFHIERIVLTSGSFSGITDPTKIANEVFIPAYKEHIEHLEDGSYDYQKEINFQWSSVTSSGGWPKLFKDERDYTDLIDYETVQLLADYARDNEVFVLVWGSMTEPAILVKHLIHTDQQDVLDNITIINHWGKSYLRSMHMDEVKTDPYAVTNSRMDLKASKYLHGQAEQGKVKMIQLGCVGQSGIVDGSANYSRIEEFRNNRLGQIFLSAKYGKNRVDQSDAATFWMLAEDLGFRLDDYPHDGTLSKEIEERNIEKFQALAPKAMDSLLERANASKGEPYPASFISKYYGYAYHRWGHYCIYAPDPVAYRILAPNGEVLKEGNLKAWNNYPDLPKKEQAYYTVELLFDDEVVVKAL